MRPPEFADALPAAAREALDALGRPGVAGRGDLMLGQGEEADRVLLVRAGRVKVHFATPRGQSVVLAFRGAGALLGEQAVLDGVRRGASVTAVEPVGYLAVAASGFRRFLHEHPAASLALISHLSLRLRDADAKRAEHVAGDTTARVAARLVELCEQYGVSDAGGGGTRISLPMTQDELAGWSGASLEAAAKALRALRSAGWIETGRREVIVHDLVALTHRASA